MRISDWSSDVCSSDLDGAAVGDQPAAVAEQGEIAEQLRQVEDRQGDRQQRRCLEGVGYRPVGEKVALDEVNVLGLRLAQRLQAREHQQQQPKQGGEVRHHAHAEVQPAERSEEHTSELQSLMRISYAVFCLKKKKRN